MIWKDNQVQAQLPASGPAIRRSIETSMDKAVPILPTASTPSRDEVAIAREQLRALAKALARQAAREDDAADAAAQGSDSSIIRPSRSGDIERS